MGGSGGQYDDYISQQRPTQRSGSSTHSCLQASSPASLVKDGGSIGAHTALMTCSIGIKSPAFPLCW